MNNMNILLTGASGFLGKYIHSALSKSKITTLGRTRMTGLHISSDLSSPPNLDQNFDIVIHNAGKAHSIPKTKTEVNDFFNVNLKGTEHILSSLSPFPPKVFVFISTIAVYGLEQGLNITESEIPLPKTPYAISKLKAEQKVKEWCKKNNVEYYILRLPLVVGKNPPGNLGAIKNAIQKGYYFKVKNNTARKSMVLAQDVASLITRLPLGASGIYNITDGAHPAFQEVESAIEHRLQKRSIQLSSLIVTSIAKFGDILNMINVSCPLNSIKLLKITSTLTFDDKEARKKLNWNPKPVLPFIKEKL